MPGMLADRIASEFDLPCHFEATSFEVVRWVDADDPKLIKKFADANRDNIAEDHSGATVFLARNEWQMNRAKQDYPNLRFLATREQADLPAAVRDAIVAEDVVGLQGGGGAAGELHARACHVLLIVWPPAASSGARRSDGGN